MTLSWNKCEGDKWCPFLTVNLDHPHFRSLEGVYIIWHGGQTPWTVYVGQGAIADRLRSHREEEAILHWASSSPGPKLIGTAGTASNATSQTGCGLREVRAPLT